MHPFGRLTLEAFKHDFVQMVGVAMILGTMLLAAGVLFYTKRWKWLWKEWITTVDPKKIGVMYLVVAALMLVKGVADGVMIRIQQMGSQTFITADHFQQVFTAHGTTMIFFVGMGAIFCLMNLVIPLQIGARDVAFPFLNAVSFWLFATGAALVVLSMIIGDFSTAGWVAYPPLSGLKYSPGVGVDYWVWSVQIAGVGSLLSGLNFLVTIIKMRCPGMTFSNMPIFIWSILCTLILILFAFPVLTATVAMLSLDRLLGMHFFTPEMGGNPMMYINLIWAWGHPEVYILILPAFGAFSEVVATFSEKRLFGYISMVWALIAITILSFIVWLHHFFTMGAGPAANAFFGIMTMFIAVPTGVKIFNWLLTMWRGRVHFTTPMLWFLSFVTTFTVGGVAGVLMSIAPVDFQVHNSLFLIAHFHSMVIGGVLFGTFSAIAYWLPKFTGFKLNEKIGRYACFFWSFGFLAAFVPLYFLGLMGATRRLNQFDVSLGWQPLFVIAAVGAVMIMVGIGLQLWQFFFSVKYKEQVGNDPWNGRTLEWLTTSPPPLYNFAHIPTVSCRDPFWEMKESGTLPIKGGPIEIEVPTNSAIPPYIGLFSFLVGFGLIWHIFPLALVSALAIIVCLILRMQDPHTEEVIHVRE